MDDAVVQQWFVVKTRAKQERAISQKMAALGVESYIPTRLELREWHDRKKRVETVLIPNTVFLRTDKQTAIDLHNLHGLSISFMRDIAGHNSLMVIPDSQMEQFRSFIGSSNGEFEVDDSLLYEKGDKILVKRGLFEGILGELVRLDGKNKVVVKLDRLIACCVELPLEDLEKINDLI